MSRYNPAAVRVELEEALLHPYLAGARRMGDVWNRRLLKAYWALESLSKLSHLDDSRSRLAVEHDLDATRFYRDFYCANRPLLIKGEIREWTALQLWTTDYLKERWGDAIVEVQGSRESSRHFETRAELHTQSMQLRTFIDLAEQGPTNDIYITARNSDSNRAALQGLWDQTGDIERYLTPLEPRAGFFWFGPKGTITPTHHDLTNNLMAQVLGRKRIVMADIRRLPRMYNHLHVFSDVDLAAVDADRFPAMRDVEVLSADIGPGDLLFLPVGWWHQVEALDISITMTFTNFRMDNEFASFHHADGEM